MGRPNNKSKPYYPVDYKSKIRDPVRIVKDYLEFEGVELRSSVEENVNLALVKLENNPYNFENNLLRMELIASAAIILNGLKRIKDPVLLYKNLSHAFERRGFCIFTPTVVHAFTRLQKDALKMDRAHGLSAKDAMVSGRIGQIHAIWLGLRNKYTKSVASELMPLKEVMKFMVTLQLAEREYAASSLVRRKDFSIRQVDALLRNTSNVTQGGAIIGAAERKDYPLSKLKELFKVANVVLSEELARTIAKRRGFSWEEFQELAKTDRFIHLVAINALKERASGHSNLQLIHGKRKDRTASINNRVSRLAKK